MNEADFENLPEQTSQFVRRLSELGLDRPRIFGLFVMLGLYAGAPDTKEKLDELFSKLNLFLPIDRSKNIDEVVGHLYDGYDSEINEFCYRSGVELSFRQIQIPGTDKIIAVVRPRDEGLLNATVKGVEKLADATLLYDSFLVALGRSSVLRGASLLEAFTCGVFQIQLHAQSDVSGSRQFAMLVRSCLPLFYAKCFRVLIEGQVDYFLGLEGTQIALQELMHPMHNNYAQQMWGFQSHLFYHENNLIPGLEEISPIDWHSWVLDRGRAFDLAYSSGLIPFSGSNITLADIPHWVSEVSDFAICDQYIHRVWGFGADSLSTKAELIEYRALLVHLIYSSLTQSRELLH